MGKWAMTLSTCVAACLWLPAAHAVSDNLYFSGTLVSEPCVLAEDDVIQELKFKTVVDKDLYLNGRTLGRPITLRLKNCDLEVGKRMVNITFEGPESLKVPGLLVAQSSTVEGLLVGLESTDGTPLPLKQTHRMAALASGDNLLTFNAYLQAEPEVLAKRTLGLGDFNASVTFALSYD